MPAQIVRVILAKGVFEEGYGQVKGEEVKKEGPPLNMLRRGARIPFGT